MANKNKYHYYVLVFAVDGCAYVTSLNNWERTAKWDKYKKPKEMSKDDAIFLANALTINGFHANTVVSNYEIVNQPYNYEKYEIDWKKRLKDDGTTD